MRSLVKVLVAVAFAAVAAGAEARPFSAEWVWSTSLSCVETCTSISAVPVMAGAITAPSEGDPSLYVCKAYAPGLEIYGERAGYNWNGRIGSNVQPGCAVVGGRRGYSFASNFWCLCESFDFN